MRYFYHPEKEHLLIVPFRCSSSFFMENATYKLHFMYLDPEHKFSREVFLKAKLLAKQKTLICRDPFFRLVSAFNTFVHTRKKGDSVEFDVFRNVNTSEDLFEHLMLCLPQIQENYKKDPHFRPISEYFNYENENVASYEILEMKNINKWLHVNFLHEFEDAKSLDLYDSKINKKNLSHIFKIYEVIKILYEDDYKLYNLRKEL